MDLALTPEQRLLVDSARAYLTRGDGLAHVRAMEVDGRGYDPKRWRELAALGWLGMTLPPDLGGSGQTLLDVALLLEEMGRVLLPSPFLPTVVVAAPLLAGLADREQQRRWLPRLAGGELVATLALAEPGWRDEWEDVALQARADGDGLRLSGRKCFVPWAAHADLLLVAVQLDGRPSLCAVEPSRPGITCTRLATFGGEPTYDVTFAEVAVAAADRLGAPGAAAAALERTRSQAAVGMLAFMVGAAERVLEMTVDYAKTRTQFGRPIGSFQAVAHRCVDMRSDLDGCATSSTRPPGAWRRGRPATWRSAPRRPTATRRCAASSCTPTRCSVPSASPPSTTCSCSPAAPRPPSSCGARPAPTASAWRGRWGCDVQPPHRRDADHDAAQRSPGGRVHRRRILAEHHVLDGAVTRGRGASGQDRRRRRSDAC